MPIFLLYISRFVEDIHRRNLNKSHADYAAGLKLKATLEMYEEGKDINH